MIVTRQFVLYNVPEVIPLGEEIGELIFNISIGYIVTYLFYYLTVYRREIKYQENAYQFVESNVERIFMPFDSVVESISKSSGVPVNQLKYSNSKFEFEKALRFIHPKIPSGRMNKSMKIVDWNEVFIGNRSLIKEQLNDILIVIQYLDPEDIQLITEILRSDYLEYIKHVDFLQFDNLDFLAEPMFNFNKLLIKLKERFPKVPQS